MDKKAVPPAGDKQIKHQKNQARIRAILSELPDICSDYYISIASKTLINTQINYLGDLRIFFDYLVQSGVLTGEISDIGIDDIKKISRTDIEFFINSYLDVYARENTVYQHEQIYENDNPGKKRKLSAVKSLFRYLQERELIKENPSALVSTPKIPEKAIRLLESDEIARLLRVIDGNEGLTEGEKKRGAQMRVRDKAIVTLLLGTGIRISELTGIDSDDVNFEQNYLLVTRKGGDSAIVYFDEYVSAAVWEYAQERGEIEPISGHENAFFLSNQRRRMTERAIENMVQKYTRVVAPQKNITPHKMRSTYGTTLYQNTGDIYLVADVLGHKDINTTRRFYARMSEENRKYAAQANKIFDKMDDDEH